MWSGQGFTGLCTFTEVRFRVSQKKYSKHVVDYSHPSKNGMTESVSTQKLFHAIVAHSKPLIKKMIFIVKVRFITSRNQIIIQEKISFNHF